MKAITKDMVISRVVREFPETRFVFASHGMGCINCMASLDETIEGGARMHGLDIASLVQDLNRVADAPQAPR